MSKKAINRPIKYTQRKKDEDKPFFSVRSLVTEITGVHKLDPGFDAARKEVERIVHIMQKFGESSGTLKVSHESKDGMVFLTKAFMPTGTAHDLYEKIRKKKKLSDEEQARLTDLFKDAVKLNQDGLEKNRLLERTLAEEEFMSLIDDINSIVFEDIQLADGIFHHAERVQLLRRYRDFLSSSMDQWRADATEIAFNEQINLRLAEICIEKGYGPGDMTPEIYNELMIELNLPDSAELARSLEMELSSGKATIPESDTQDA